MQGETAPTLNPTPSEAEPTNPRIMPLSPDQVAQLDIKALDDIANRQGIPQETVVSAAEEIVASRSPQPASETQPELDN